MVETNKAPIQKDRNMDNINPQRVSFLLCYKYIDPQQERGLLYYEVIPLLPVAASTKMEDLRSEKTYRLPQGNAQAQGGAQMYKDLLKDYGIDTKVQPTYCQTLSYRSILNIAHLSGVSAQIFFIDNVDTFERLPPKYLVELCEKMVQTEKTKAKEKLSELNSKINKSKPEEPIRS